MKKTIAIIALLILAIGQTHTMHRVASKTTLPYLKKGFSGIMTSMHWIIAAGLPIGYGTAQAYYLLNEKRIYDSLEDTNKLVTNFVRSNLKKTQVDRIKINPFGGNSIQGAGAFGRSSLLFSPSICDKITKAVEENNEKETKKFQAVLEHEESHLYYNDTACSTFAYLTAPFITHTLTKKAINSLPLIQKMQPFCVQQFIKIPTGLGKLAITMSTVTGLSRYQEQRADNSISNNRDLLNGMKERLEECEQETMNSINSFDISPKKIKLAFFVDRFFGSHPPAVERIKKLDKRIALLEKETEKNDTQKDS